MKTSSALVYALALTLAVAAIQPLEAVNQEKKVLLVEVNGFISSATAEHIGSAVDAASQPGYTAILLTIDTFGGSADAMFKIVDEIQASPIPVIGFVYPAGRQALSAGVYILMASDFAAMAPYTTIGSAQPIVGTTPVTDSKIINVYVQKMVSYARLHGRNETQAARFITENDNLLPEEALKLSVIEVVAESSEELLGKVDGAVVKTLSGERVLDTSGAVIVSHSPSIRDQVLSLLSDPLVSSILISVGFLALILGLSSPGWGAEVAGLVLLLLGLVGQGFNVNYTAVLLLAIGSGLILFEIYSPGFGLPGLGGIIVLGLGMVLMVTQPALPQLVSREYIDAFIRSTALALTLSGIFFGFTIYKAAKVTRLKRVLEPLPKGEGRAVDDITPDTVGYVVVAGEYWRAKSRYVIKAGQRVKVTGSEDKILIVELQT